MNRPMRLGIYISAIAIILSYSTSPINAMKRALTESSEQTSLDETVGFDNLPSELLPKILMYTRLSKQTLMLSCKRIYDLLCFNNHLNPNVTSMTGQCGISLCKNCPELVSANRFDCQRMYYIFIKADDCVHMEQLIKLDKDWEKNLEEVIRHCFDKPVEKVTSHQMQTLIYQYSSARNSEGKWCPACSVTSCEGKGCEVCLLGFPEFTNDGKTPFFTPFTQAHQQLIDCVMHGDSNKLQKLIATATLESIAKRLRVKASSATFTYLFRFCSYNTRAQLIQFIKEKDPDYNYNLLLHYRDEAIVNSDYARLEDLVVEHGIDLDISYSGFFGDQEPILVAIDQAIEKNDYRLLNFLITYGVDLNLDLDNANRGFGFKLSEETKLKLLSYFNQHDINKCIGTIVSPLLYAVLLDNVKLVQTLLKGDVDLSGPQSCPEDGDEDEQSPTSDILDIAKALGNQVIIKAIERKRQYNFVNAVLL